MTHVNDSDQVISRIPLRGAYSRIEELAPPPLRPIPTRVTWRDVAEIVVGVVVLGSLFIGIVWWSAIAQAAAR